MAKQAEIGSGSADVDGLNRAAKTEEKATGRYKIYARVTGMTGTAEVIQIQDIDAG